MILVTVQGSATTLPWTSPMRSTRRSLMATQEFTLKHLRKLMERVNFDKDTGCWIWEGAKDSRGYGQIRIFDKIIGTHRLMTFFYFGEMGQDTDHLCRNPSCCNPAHLEPVSHQENVRRGRAMKTHCPKGHPKTEDNRYRSQYGKKNWSACKICVVERARHYREKKRAAECH